MGVFPGYDRGGGWRLERWGVESLRLKGNCGSLHFARCRTTCGRYNSPIVLQVCYCGNGSNSEADASDCRFRSASIWAATLAKVELFRSFGAPVQDDIEGGGFRRVLADDQESLAVGSDIPTHGSGANPCVDHFCIE